MLLHAQSPDTVLVSNSLAKVTRAEYDAELLKLPPDLREGFANNPRRVFELLQRMLVQKSLAAQARNSGLDKRPDVKARLDFESRNSCRRCRSRRSTRRCRRSSTRTSPSTKHARASSISSTRRRSRRPRR
jgi:hypothetical protein